MIAAALAATLQLALAQTTWEADLRAGVRVLEGDVQDLVLEPRAEIERRRRELDLRAAYFPYVLFRRVGDAPLEADVVHRLTAAAEVRLSRDTQLRLGEALSIGPNDFSWVASAPDAPPAIATFRRGESVESVVAQSATLGLDQALSRELHLGVSGSFALGGALHDDAISIFPRTETVSGSASLAYVLGHDAWFAGVNASHTTSTGDLWSNLVGATASWRHAFSAASQRALVSEDPTPLGESPPARYESELGAGLAYLGGAPSETHGGQPNAWATLLRITERRAGAWGGRLTGRYTPMLDPTRGLLEPRGEGSLRAELRLDRDVLATLAGGLAYTKHPSPPTPTWSGQSGLLLDWEAARWVTLGAQLRVAWLPGPTWAAVATATFATRGRLD